MQTPLLLLTELYNFSHGSNMLAQQHIAREAKFSGSIAVSGLVATLVAHFEQVRFGFYFDETWKIYASASQC
jgi:hypothetical protein